MTEVDRVFHQSFKPSWGPESTLLYAMPTKIDLSKSKSAQNEPQFLDQKGCFISEGKDVRLAKFAVQHPVSSLVPIPSVRIA